MGVLKPDEHWEALTSADPDFAELSEELKDWLVGKRYDIEPRKWLEGGSGSYVMVARQKPGARGRRFDDIVLKLIPPDIGAEETDRARAAGGSDPASFRQAHLVEVLDDDRLPGRNWWIHFEKVAQGNLDQMPTLAELLDKPNLHKHCTEIVTSLMTEWNDGAGSGPREKPKDFLKDFLQDRLDQDQVLSFGSREGISLDGSQRVRFPGRNDSLPNPFALVTGLNGEDQTGEEIFRGNSHGDLHARNVLIPVRKPNYQVTATEYQLIDLGRFDKNGPLSHDPMKLLLAIATEWLPSLVPHSAIRSSLAELVVSPASYPDSAPVAGYLTVVKGIHDAAEEWAEGHGAGDVWRGQNLLVMIGCALRYFAHEELRDADRWWYLEVAALAMRELVEDDDRQGYRLTTSPTESCASGRTQPQMAAPVRGQQQARDGADNVIDFPGPRAVSDPAPLLTDLANGISRLPTGASESRLAVLAINLEEEAQDLDDALESAEQIVLIQNELSAIRKLLAKFGGSSSPDKTVRELRAAGERLRSYGRERWPGEVG